MSEKTSPVDTLAELAALLEDPQVREFLFFYLSIREPAARAHLQRALADAALASSGASLSRRIVRQQRLRLSPASPHKRAKTHS